MRHFLYCALLSIVLFSTNVVAQEFNIYLSSTDLNVFASDSISTPVSFPADWILKADQKETGFTHFTIVSGGNELTEFSLKPLDYNLFKAKFKNSIRGLFYDQEEKITIHNIVDENEAILSLYSKITSYFFSINERPQVAVIRLKEDIDVYSKLRFKKKDENEETLDNIYIGALINANVKISFYSGFIEKIEVKGTINGIPITFSNKYSIGVSSLENIKNFDKIKIISHFEHLVNFDSIIKISETSDISGPEKLENIIDISETRNSLDRKNKVTVVKNNNDAYYSVKVNSVKKTSKNLGREENSLYIFLNDLIEYERIIDVNANDISPDKQVIGLDTLQQSAKLYKEESTKILEAVIFSDLLGTFDEDNPSGIIQTEVSKRFNINTTRNDIGNGKIWFGLIMPPFLISESFGTFEYLDAKVLLSKIEDDNKYLLPDSESGKLTLLGLYQHRNFSVGGTLNFLAFENQNLKFNMFFDMGFEFSKSGFKLTEDSDPENLNFMEYNLELKFHLFPEKRYGIFVTDKLSYFETLDDDLSTLSFDETSFWMNTVEFKAYLDVSTSSKLFARYRLIHEMSDIDNNFSQFQLGVSFYLLEKNRKDK